MVGRVYRWRGETWRVVVRWAGRAPRNVLIERVEACYRDEDCAMYACSCRNTGWRPVGERVVRPFRGLRKVGP